MPTATTVVTPARYAQGLTYADFLAQAAVNVDKFEQNYKSAPLSAEDLTFFKRAAAQPGADERERNAGEVTAAARTTHDDVGIIIRHLELHHRLLANDGLVQQDMVEDAA